MKVMIRQSGNALSAYHCFGSLEALFEEYQWDTDFISERQNVGST